MDVIAPVGTSSTWHSRDRAKPVCFGLLNARTEVVVDVWRNEYSLHHVDNDDRSNRNAVVLLRIHGADISQPVANTGSDTGGFGVARPCGNANNEGNANYH